MHSALIAQLAPQRLPLVGDPTVPGARCTPTPDGCTIITPDPDPLPLEGLMSAFGW
jgi:hypothetical protein